MEWICKEYGKADSLHYQALEDLAPQAHEVQVKVSYVGLNFPDLLVIQGKDQYRPSLPFSPCGEMSGEIVAVGTKVDGFNIGDRVFAGGMVWGCSKSKVCVPAQNVYKVPTSMSMQEAAVLPCVFGTAIHCLKDRAQLQAGETVAILGAAGGVGLATIQVAKMMGAKVIACASTPEKREFCLQHGADIVVDYTNVDLKQELKRLTDGKGVDVVCDPVGSQYSEPALRAIAYGGRFMVLGFTAGQIARVPLNLPLLKTAQIMGVFWSTFARKFPPQNRSNIHQILQWYEEGNIKVHVDAVYPFHDLPRAFQALESRTIKGKIILDLAAQ
ncbi:MAG: NADPH:quinone oxidoreductase family protein [Bacteroidota bacterium]